MEVSVPSAGLAGNGAPSPSLPAMDPSRLVDHLIAVIEVALGATRDELERPGSLLHRSRYDDTVARCARFANDAQSNALYIQKDVVVAVAAPAARKAAAVAAATPENGGGPDDDETGGAPTYAYTLTPEMSSSPATVTSLILLRVTQALDPTRSLQSQICMTILPGPVTLNASDAGDTTSPFEVLHSHVHLALVPYFDANTKSLQLGAGAGPSAGAGRGRSDLDAKTGIPVTKKRLNDLELSLLHLQQNVEIPVVSLLFHNVVQNALDQAAAQGGRPSVEAVPGILLQDSSFLNSLQSNVNVWIKSIQVVTKMTRVDDPAAGTGPLSGLSQPDLNFTASQEVNFWLSMESALEGIEAQLRSEGVVLTLEILKHAKRFQAMVSFTSDTGLKEGMEKVQRYNQLMREFPLDELLSAATLARVRDAVVQIFAHLGRKLKISTYPVRRVLTLVEAISADLDEALRRLLPGSELVNLDYREFGEMMAACEAVFKAWEDYVKDFTITAREVTRRRNDRFIPIKIIKRHGELESRLAYISKFRSNHEQLQRTIVTVLGPGGSESLGTAAAAGEVAAAGTGTGAAGTAAADGVLVASGTGGHHLNGFGFGGAGEDGIDAAAEVRQAWEALQGVDLLDITDQGRERWVRAENLYNERTTRVENSIIARLRDRLATAKNASEMFRVFSKFNALLVRPKIRGAIAEYQNQLMEHVRTAIENLQERFKQRYGHSEAHAMAQLRDLPPVAGAIVWARQIEHQLNGYMGKVADVLGQGWMLHTEGQQLYQMDQMFRKKLETRPIYEAWLQDVNRRRLTIAGPLFEIVRSRRTTATAAGAAAKLELAVNFDPQIITLFKETRNLTWQNFAVPHAVTTVSKDAKRVYPYAVSLMESVRTLNQTISQIGAMGEEEAELLNGHRNDAFSLVERGIPLRWESFVGSHDLFLHQQHAHSRSGGAGAAAGAAVPTSATTAAAATATAKAVAAMADYAIARGSGTDGRHGAYIREIGAAVSLLQIKTASLVVAHAGVERTLSELSACPYDSAAFRTRLGAIQAAVDQLSLEQYVNLGYWVEKLNERIRAALLARLRRAVAAWTSAFEGEEGEESDDRGADEGGAGRQKRVAAALVETGGGGSKPDGPTLPRLVHELTMRNQVIYLDPPLEFARASWFRHLHSWLAIACAQRRLRSTRFRLSLAAAAASGSADSADGEDQEPRFDGLAAECADLLGKAHAAAERRLGAAAAYVDEWLRFQALWDLRPDHVYEALGGQPLASWLQLLHDIRRSRATFDTQEASRPFGHVLSIDYDQVQTRVGAKYDQWQHEILARFAARLGQRMRDVHADMERARTELEGSSLDPSSTASAVRFITAVQACRRSARAWAPELDTFREGEATLRRQRHPLPRDWLPHDRVEGQWASLREQLERRARAVEDQTDALRAKITAEDRAVADRIAEAAARWEEEKPVSGAIAPEAAAATLTLFETRASRLRDEAGMLARAREALDLVPGPTAAAAEASLQAILEEVQDFQSVWTNLATVWAGVREARETLWTAVTPRKVRARLEDLLRGTREMPSRMRQYAAFEHVQAVLRALSRVNPTVAELRSESVRDRHWDRLWKRLRPGQRYSPVAMTLGDVWDLIAPGDGQTVAAASEAAVAEVIAQAQGEMGLEEFLRQVRETWSGYALDLVGYRNKCRLIRGWDELFAKCQEHLTSLQQMRHSPYYREFEEEASGWEDKLNRVHVLFDVWIDVQRQWVYLEGVFTGNADIKHLLPIESARFQNIDSEFGAVMRKVYKQPYVLDVLNIPNAQKSLERLAELLHKIQKALGEYLERERASFPRFYFVGDEDLLEMIGNGGDAARIAKHLGKMFAGLAGVVMAPDGSPTDASGADEPGYPGEAGNNKSGGAGVIAAFTSREGEVVPLRRPISLARAPRINDWLGLLEAGMRSTLAELLAEAAAAYGPLFEGAAGAPPAPGPTAAASSEVEIEPVKTDAAADTGTLNGSALRSFLECFPGQVAVLATQVVWTAAVEGALTSAGGDRATAQAALQTLLRREVRVLALLAEAVLLGDLDGLTRRKSEHLITECVHQRGVIERLLAAGAASPDHHLWLLQMRYAYEPEGSGTGEHAEGSADMAAPEGSRRLLVRMANARLSYGFEYLGVPDRLVRTPLTDRCFLTLTQALCQRLGGSPYGPAGTGKTESVKALGLQLGRFTLVFCCDDTFDFQAMGRIFLGICQVGAWGCFDEFNRLEEKILSAVSQQIQNIQAGLRRRGKLGSEGHDHQGQLGQAETIDLAGRQVRVHDDTGIFITMNPGYAGRSNLPDNLKKLFRSVAMSRPDKELIAEVMLYSQGFGQAARLARQTVPFFDQCAARLSRQAHYDFGLRALKSVLVSSGGLKRARLLSKEEEVKGGKGGGATEDELEPEILVQSIRETIAPKLVRPDVDVMLEIEAECFPGVQYVPARMDDLQRAVRQLAAERHLVVADAWLAKVLQLFQMQRIHHGVMMVGSAGTGKSAAWRVLLDALQRVEGVEAVAHVIDPKVMSKEALYGSLDATTREWTDGLFTGALRKIVDNLRGEDTRRHWIVFDGDVDPEWVENLNSVLDDNRLLTLPNGERLALPPNVRVVFEVETLRYATPATVSRCGMVWFGEETVTAEMMVSNYLSTLRSRPLGDPDEEAAAAAAIAVAATAGGAQGQSTTATAAAAAATAALAAQAQVADLLRGYLLGETDKEDESGGGGMGGADGGSGGSGGSDGSNLISAALALARDPNRCPGRIMEFSTARALATLFALLSRAARDVVEYNGQHPEFPLDPDQVAAYVSKKLLLALVWALAGDCPLEDRKAFGDAACALAAPFAVPPPAAAMTAAGSVLDYAVAALPRPEWTPWQAQVPSVEVNTDAVAQADVVIPTLDTIRHEDVLYAWLAERRPVLLCGPPGSGKTMTLFSALRKLPNLDVVGLNFSSATTPGLLIKTLEQYCEYRKSGGGTGGSSLTLAPAQIGRRLVVFCDEINLPAPDRYGTQRAVAFLRQLVEQGGFWRRSAWVTLDRVQFVGACNPPTDAGRSAMAARFLRHAPLVMVDYPGETSLRQIYGTLNAASLKAAPPLRGHADALTGAMVRLYLESRARFAALARTTRPHYVYSPRELTRWVRGVYEAIRPLETPPSLEGLVRIWAHEALRLFRDRLVDEDERAWTDEAVRRIGTESFPGADPDRTFGAGPILFSNWLSKHYGPVELEPLREFVRARLRTFCEEEVDVPLILYDDVLEHALRIDRVFRQPQGHLILIGVSGSGKTTLARFVAWMNGLRVCRLRPHRRYTGADFDEDLREVLRRCGCRGERVCFILDEASVLDSAFLERMNTLLANAEVPGLFEGDDLAALMTACREGALRQNLHLDAPEELHRWFTQQIVRNLHVVFTMNPPAGESGGGSGGDGDGEGDGPGSLSSRAATSPALFNRCVLNWMGDWSDRALFQVGRELTRSLDLDRPDYATPGEIPIAAAAPRDLMSVPPSHRDAVVNAMVNAHRSVRAVDNRLRRQRRGGGGGSGGGGRVVAFLTPCHFLDFATQYVRLFGEKRDDLEEQQRHLNVGLEKLRDTVAKVAELRAGLAEKQAALERKDGEANEKLRRMVADQREAERREATSLEIQRALDRQEAEVAARRQTVLEDLARAEPAVEEARASVRNIKRQHLTEVRSMGSPPAGVRLALDSVCALLGHRVADWKAIQQVVRGDDFIASIVNFDSEARMTKQLRQRIRAEFLSNPDFSFDRVNRASKACGPLVQWVEAQVGYADMLDSVGPLREEVSRLEAEALQTRAEAQAIENTISELGRSIAAYKDEYAALISETQAIRAEMAAVELKVKRSVGLLDSLSSERARWEEGSRSFETQIGTLPGDSLVAAAFLAYGGLYDQPSRRAMADDWLDHLRRSGIRFKAQNPATEYLSTPDQRLRWQRNTLPADDLCTENAIILARAQRYPLVIDPSGRVVEFLQRECQQRDGNNHNQADKGSSGSGGSSSSSPANRLTVTSFLDAAFPKQLESALRFGNSILIQDAEHLDPILNQVLNREYQRTGGRVLVELGRQQIDFSPAFRLYLATRDPSAAFPPDVCSRTTLVNFTVTQASLRAQSLDAVLRAERPDVDENRSNLLRAQGEFRMHLRALERQLLQALNESRGNILDDDHVIETLERLKRDAADITAKMARTEGVMAEVDQVTARYGVVAKACGAVFAVLEQLPCLNHFYQFSLQYFYDIFHEVLAALKKSSAGAVNEARRRDHIVRRLFIATFRRTAPALLQRDRVTLAVLLAQASPYKMNRGLVDALLDIQVEGRDLSHSRSIESARDEALARASRLVPAIRDRLSRVQSADWDRFLSADELVELPSAFWNEGELDAELKHRQQNQQRHRDGDEGGGGDDDDNNSDDYTPALLRLLLAKLLRIDLLVPAAERFVGSVFGPDFRLDAVEDLDAAVSLVPATRPVALVSTPGFDASYRVDSLAASRNSSNSSLAAVAMGSSDAAATADKAVAAAAQTGSWVLVKNVHLAPDWLQSLEKRVDALNPHPDFRLFLSMEASPKAIPVSLLRASRVLMFEQPAGMRANMRDSLGSSPAAAVAVRAQKPPAERARLYLLLSFLHAVVQERLRYAPTLGWKGFWEFNDADYECAAFVVDTWVEAAALSRTNIAPANIPWDMIRALVADTCYGGKIDDEGDLNLLRGLVERILTPAAYDIGYRLVEGVVVGGAEGGEVRDDDGEGSEGGLAVPAGTSLADMMAWVSRLPEREPPTYLGLPANAEKLLLAGRGADLVRDVGKVVELLDEGEKLVE